MIESKYARKRLEVITVYKIAICDDDAEFRGLLEKQVKKAFLDRETEVIIRSYDDIASLNRSVESGGGYDLLFLDILFDDGNGMEYAKKLRKSGIDSDIIFITIAGDYAIESYDVDPLYYILKPLKSDRLEVAMNRFFENRMPVNVSFDTSNGIIRVKIDEILYFEIYGHKIVIHKSDGTESAFHGSLKDIESQLPRTFFVRPHRSYIVNMNYITEIMRFDIKISNGEYIPISKAQYNRIQLKFLNFLDGKDLYI